MSGPKVVSREEWLAARKKLLAEKKELTRRRDAVAAARRELPMVEVENYVFRGPDGRPSLRDLFEGRLQLIVYHFMYHPDWEEGCKSCSFLADTFNGAILHLRGRDTSFAAISRAPIEKLVAFRERMGWTFPWVSSHGSSFNYDFHVSFTPEEIASGKVTYNFAPTTFPGSEAPGASVFLRDGDRVFHTYSTYGRGLDHLIATYEFLDLTPLGRNEGDLEFTMAWVRHHDRY